MKSAEEMYQDAMSALEDDGHQVKIQKLEALLQNYSDFAPAHDQLGSIHYQLGNFDAALQHFEAAARLDPDNIRIQKNLADFYHTVLSLNEEALACYRKVLAIAPDDSEAYLIAANLLVTLHRFDEAEELYKKLLALEPWRLDINEIITKIRNMRAKDKPLSSEEKYQQARKMAEQNDPNGAIHMLEQIIADDPEYALAHNDLGVLHGMIGEIQASQMHYEKAIALDPDNIVFKKNLAEYYVVVKRDLKKALELYLSILKDHPYDIETLSAAANISIKFGLLENSRVFCEAILDIEPWNMEASEWLAEIERKSDSSANKIAFK